MSKPGILIYNYLNCRTYLKDKCEELKNNRSYFSYRQLSLKADIKSPSFISSFIAGKKNMSYNVALKISGVLELDPNETGYFLSLLNLTQGKTHEEKKIALTQCLEQAKDHQTINAETLLLYDYYSRWYNVVIRDLVEVFPVDDDYEKLASFLDPSITPTQAKEAIELLLKLGLIMKNQNGYYGRANRFLTSKSYIKTTVAHDFQIEMMKKAQAALSRHSRETRDISTLTLSVDQSTYKQIFKMIESFRKSVMSLVQTVEKPDQVIQLNVQAFPVSKCSPRN